MDSSQALDAASEALLNARGADWGDFFLKRSAARNLYFTDGKIEEISSSVSAGCSARLLRGRYTALASASGVERDALLLVWKDVCRQASVAAPSLPELIVPLERPRAYFPDDWEICYRIDRELRHECPWIRQIVISGGSACTCAGLATRESSRMWQRESSSFSVSVLLERDGRVENGYSSWRRRGSAREFFDCLDLERMARKALDRAMLNLEAVECPAGVMPVVLSDRAGGTIIHEACGHGMEADLVYEEDSCFAGLVGEPVAADNVTIVDDATVPDAYGSYDCDDEGTAAQRTVLVENGILKNYLTDRRSAMLYQLPLTGNGRRSGYSSIPQPRMSNTFVVPGTEDEGEMIAGVRQGLYVKSMGGGEVNTTTGEFVFEVTEGYLIENGAVTKPVKGATLIGTGPEALKNIRAVGKHLHLDSGICEKEGQSVPVTDGQPSLLIEGLTVGGTATE